MRKKIELPESCNFSDYFKWNYYSEDLLEYFGYKFASKELFLPQSQKELEGLSSLDRRLRRSLPYIAVELIAVDRAMAEAGKNQLYGAVSIGKIWQFSVLSRLEKQITQDLNLYRVPADLAELMRILVAILTGE